MGSVTLHQQKGTAKALTHLFTSCIDMAAELQSKIRTLEADNQRLAQERQNALKVCVCACVCACVRACVCERERGSI